MAFKVLQGGIFTTIQDEGRKGVAHLGHCNSGALDMYAYHWSQKLLGNTQANALEVMAGLKLEAMKPTTISITGADLGLEINGNYSDPWQTYAIEAGDILYFSKRITGQRAYLAVKGGFDAPRYLGSYATTIKEGFGDRLKAEDILPYQASAAIPITRIKTEYIPNYDAPLTLRVILGYQHNFFDDKEKEKFFNSEYAVTLQSDRMGYRLSGEGVFAQSENLISEGIAFGAIQIPNDGQPIILLKERQTIGGYPKMGTVIPEDCYALTQRGAGCKVQFEPYTIEQG
jgi:biotin-dependent carboxylase-like uncharacterized protein